MTTVAVKRRQKVIIGITHLRQLLKGRHVALRCLPVSACQDEDGKVNKEEDDEEDDVSSQRADEKHKSYYSKEQKKVRYISLH